MHKTRRRLVVAAATLVLGTELAGGVADAKFSPSQTLTGPWYGTRGTFFTDLTGDGRADAIVVNDYGVTVRRSLGTSVGGDEMWIRHPWYGSRATAFADVTGDGRSDALVVNDHGITVRRSNGNGFGGDEAWTLSGPVYGSRSTHFADVDGDARADAVHVNDAGVAVRRSTGTGFGAAETWISHAWYGSRATAFADVTGDGRADAVVVNDWGITVRRANGNRFDPNDEVWHWGAYYGARNTEFADVTGDGRADAIVVNDSVVVRASLGDRFTHAEDWTTGTFYGTRGTHFADIDGDRRADVIATSESGTALRRSKGPVGGEPWLVTLGDSFISGEGGRWAGNTRWLSWDAIDTSKVTGLGPSYDQYDQAVAPMSGCHRSKSAEAHIGIMRTVNLACSGSRTDSHEVDGDYKPGFEPDTDDRGRKSQVVMLEEFARVRDVRLITISIGGNNFKFGTVTGDCLEAFIVDAFAEDHCRDDPSVTKWFSPESVEARTAEIAEAINNVRNAMGRVGYKEWNYTIVVQGYVSPVTRWQNVRYPENMSRQSKGGCGFYDEDIHWMTETVLPTINGAVKAAVERTGAPNVRFLDLSQAFEGHGLCDRRAGHLEEKGLTNWQQDGASNASEWVNLIRVVNEGPSELVESFHPNYWGQLALRNCLRKAWNRGAPISGRCVSGIDRNAYGEPNVSFSTFSTTPVPHVVGLPYDDAADRVRAAGFVPAVGSPADTTCDPNKITYTVTKQHPSGAALANPGDKVSLWQKTLGQNCGPYE